MVDLVVMEKDIWTTSALLWFILLFHPLATINANLEGDVLHELRTKLFDPKNVLQSWDPLVNPCTWFHVTCNNNNNIIRVDLGNSALSGQLVPQLGQLKHLEYLELYSNNISGSIPFELGNLTSLVSLDLYLNKFTGSIPHTLSKLSNLRFLDLSNNHLSGVVPDNGSFSLFTPISFANNVNLCGPVTGHPCPGSPPFSPPPPFVQPPPASSPAGDAGFSTGTAAGVAAAAALLFVVPAIGLAWCCRGKSQEHYFDLPAEEDPRLHFGQLKRFSLRELKVATDNFSVNNLLGSGGCAKVYKGRLMHGSLVAVKRLHEERKAGGEKQFQTEVEMISRAVHRNLLPLLGFCMTPTERLLVYPYMANGSLASCLRGREPSRPPLDWPTRKRIALGSAKGLSYLYNHCVPKIIHRDVKAANILLDEKFEAIVGDFGLAKLMDNNIQEQSNRVRGTIGHIAPESYFTGNVSEKTDVFGYGMMLLELITGLNAYSLARLENNEAATLHHWVEGHMEDENRLERVVDPNLTGYVDCEVEQLIQLALRCTRESPLDRPKMSEVEKMLEGDGLAERWEEWPAVEVVCQEVELAPGRNSSSSAYSTVSLAPQPEHLSGPR